MNRDLVTRIELDTLIHSYISVLDNDRLEEWPEFFLEECLYEIIPKENHDAGFPAPVIHCSNRRMLRDRVISLRHANVFAPVTYRHMISGMVWSWHEDDTIAMSSSYVVVATSQDGESGVYQAGRYIDRVVRTEAGWRFREKRVVYDTLRVQTLLAIPI